MVRFAARKTLSHGKPGFYSSRPVSVTLGEKRFKERLLPRKSASSYFGALRSRATRYTSAEVSREAAGFLATTFLKACFKDSTNCE